MKWISDKSGRFPERPYYESDELDYECEALISSFLVEKNGEVSYPISTNDLTILIERETSDLDLYADLTKEGVNVEGMTVFSPKIKPKVYISENLTTSSSRINRQRTTLTHELGHVKFHNFIWVFQQATFLDRGSNNLTIRCNRDSILNASAIDWMEWQAGYASGAYLMPITPLKTIVRRIYEETCANKTETVMSDTGRRLIAEVQTVFQVSEDAARVRLLKLGNLTEGKNTTSSAMNPL